MPRRKKRILPDLSLDPETAHGILTVVVFAIAAILLLSLFDMAGGVGRAIDGAMGNAIGWDRIALPFFMFAVGINRLTPERFPLKGTNYIGFILFFFSLNPLIHTVQSAGTEAVDIAKAGGAIGALLSEPFVGLFGRFGAGTVFFALAVVSFLLVFNASLKQVVAFLLRILAVLKRVGLAMLAPFRWIVAKQKERVDEAVRAEAAKPAVQPSGTQPPKQQTIDDALKGEEEEVPDIETQKNAPIPKPRKKRQPRVEVPIELLWRRDQKPNSGDIQRNQYVIQRTLETFGIPVEMEDVSVGPTVTQFTLKPSEGIKLTRITALHNDLALALAAHPIRIEAPIPGKALVGIEVPNQSVATVGMREIMEAKEWKDRKSDLCFALGRDVSGKPWLADIGRMPHLLVAGATGSGKSVCLNTVIMSLIYENGPDELKFVMVDPKRVELQVYNGIPHLVTPVITDTTKTINALKWALREMDHRFDVLSKFGARDIASYNERSSDKLPYIAIVVDELADLMVTAMAEVEGPIVRLAQMSRAVGIHLILATQRPSVDVLTGLIKANIPARIAFAVASSVDSRTILDAVGAEKLIGRGDMLFQTADMSTPKRIQGSFVSDDEIQRVVEYLKSAYDPADYDPNVVEAQSAGTSFIEGGVSGGDSDPLIGDAKEEIVRAGKASASLLQRRLKVGYARAARLLDLLEMEGFIGPGDGAKPREILHVEFSKQVEQASAPLESSVPSHPALEQVDREIPEIE